MRTKLHLIILILSTVFHISAQEFSIIPKPAEVSMGNGSFTIDNSCGIQFDTNSADLTRIAGFFSEYLENAYSIKLNKNTDGKSIRFKIISRLNLGNEGYLLKVKPNSIIITASKPNGLFYGMQTLKQMLPVEATNGKLEIATIDIKDQPRFAWRGNMLDVGRHFFPC